MKLLIYYNNLTNVFLLRNVLLLLWQCIVVTWWIE